MLPALFHKAEIDGFLVAHGCQSAAYRKRAALRFRADFGCDGCQRWRGGQVVEAHHAHDFFDQIFFDLDVKTVRWRCDRDGFICCGEWQTQFGESIHTLRLADRHANDLGCTSNAQVDRLDLGHIGLQIVNRACRTATDIQHELRNALDVLNRQLWVDTALKAVTGIGREVEAA